MYASLTLFTKRLTSPRTYLLTTAAIVLALTMISCGAEEGDSGRGRASGRNVRTRADRNYGASAYCDHGASADRDSSADRHDRANRNWRPRIGPSRSYPEWPWISIPRSTPEPITN